MKPATPISKVVGTTAPLQNPEKQLIPTKKRRACDVPGLYSSQIE